MNEANTKPGAQDRERINVEEEGELQDWATKFDATPKQIREAVGAVGPCAADVEMHLKGTHATSNADQEARTKGL